MALIQVIEAWKGKPLEELLKELYLDKDMSMKEIANELCISIGVVHRYLTKFHICKQKDLWNLK